MSNRSISRECGYEANVQGEPRSANPHISGTFEYNEWFAGWDEADCPASAVILTGFDQLASWVDDHCGGNQLADTPADHITAVERVAKQLQHEAECESIHYGDDWAEFLESVEWGNVLRFVAREVDQITADEDNPNSISVVSAESIDDQQNLSDVWNACTTPIYRVLDEDGVNVASGKIRRLAQNVWLYLDDTDGATFIDDDGASRLNLIPESKHIPLGWDNSGNVIRL